MIAIVIGTYANVGAIQVPPWPWSDGAGSSATSCSSIPSSSPSSACRSCSRTAGCHRPASVGSCGSRSPAWSPGPSRACCSIPRASRGSRVMAPSHGDAGPAGPVSGPADLLLRLRPRRFGWRSDRRVAALSPWRPCATTAGQMADRRRRAGSDPPALGAASYRRQPGPGQHAERFGIIAMFALPVVIGLAILRYRLYEIDRLISRTIALRDPDGDPGGRLRGIDHRVADPALIGDPERDDRRRRLHAARIRAVPAGPADGAGRRRPQVRPASVRRRPHVGRLRRSPAPPDRHRQRLRGAPVDDRRLGETDEPNLWLRRDLR